MQRTSGNICTSILLTVFCLAHSAALADTPPPATFVQVGPHYSNAVGVSADGATVVGNSYVPFVGIPNSQAFLWTPDEGVAPLVDPPLGSTAAAAISGDGMVVVGNMWPGEPSGGFYWTAQDGFSSIAGPGTGTAWPRAISADGNVVVGTYGTGAGDRAFRWTPLDGLLDLGVLPGHALSHATAASADGSVIVGRSGIVWSASSAFRWTAEEGMVDLGTIAGATMSGATGVSADGFVIVGWAFGPDGMRAFRWTKDDGMNALSDTDAEATAVNSDGSVVAGFTHAQYPGRAFVWHETSGMLDLHEHLSSFQLDLIDWTLIAPEAVSADGRTIVGWGWYDTNDPDWCYETVNAAWFATIPAITQPCPPADLNCDGVVDGADLLILLSQWGKCNDPDNCPADLNDDGTVDGADLLVLLSNWG